MVRVGLLTRLSSIRARIKYMLFCFVFVSTGSMLHFQRTGKCPCWSRISKILSTCCTILCGLPLTTIASHGFLRECFQPPLASFSLILHFSCSSPLLLSGLMHILFFWGEVHLLQHPPKEFQGGFLSL